MRAIVLVQCAILLASCSSGNEQACRPGNYDGPWNAVGTPAPDQDMVRRQLAGKDMQAALKVLGRPHRVEETAGGASVVWAFASEKSLIERDCKGPDRVLFRQSFLLISADVRGDKIVSCTTQERGSLGPQRIGLDQALNMKVQPLDHGVMRCAPLAAPLGSHVDLGRKNRLNYI